jgi:lipopolysaccharide biosynthesis protein
MRFLFNQFLSDPALTFSFCLHWANEPWTSSWDGKRTSRILLPQEHSPEDDLEFIRDIERALLDERYIRINGKPLLLVYRPGLFPDIRATVERWQRYCRGTGIGELYLAVMQQDFDGRTDPGGIGFDAAVEFPPHNVSTVSAKDLVALHDHDFSGRILSYPHMVKGSLKRSRPDYRLFRGLTPSWDCTARRRDPTVFVGSTPDLYQEWLEGLCRSTRQHLPLGERLIFINAWNEWAEGAYLEPDQKYGYAFLNRTAAGLMESEPVD